MRKFLGYLMVLGVLAALYSVVIFSPFVIDHMSAKDLVNSTFNSFREFPPEAFKKVLLDRLNQVDWATHPEADDFGEVKEMRGLGLTEDDVFVEFDDRTKILDVRVTYTRRVQLKPTDKIKVLKFTIARKEKPPNVF